MSRIIVIPDDSELDSATKAELRLRFEKESCRFCGGLHQRECPRVKKVIYNPSDQREVREVEYWNDSEWDHSCVLWPDDVI
jgi:hypothetical protein